MQHIIFSANPNAFQMANLLQTQKIAILIKTTSFNKTDLLVNYVKPLTDRGLSKDNIIAFDLEYDSNGKAPVKMIKAYLKDLLAGIDALGITTLMCCDGPYFKTLAGQRKTSGHLGYIYPCKIPGYEHISVILSINHSALFHDPTNQSKIDLANKTLADHINDNYVELGSGIIHSEYYPSGYTDIANTLIRLHDHPALTCDIEAFSLRFNEAGIGTVAFAWDEHNGIAFAVDWIELREAEKDGTQGIQENTIPIKRLLREFLESYKGKLIYHNSQYDLKLFIYELWMRFPLDYEGQLEGLEIVTRNIDDTKVIAFLAQNSTSGNNLGLKENAHEYAGNYAQEEINDIRKIPIKELLTYNLVDCLSTWFIHKRDFPILVSDDQLRIYREIMIPSIKVLINMELNGMPMYMQTIRSTSDKLKGHEMGFKQDIYDDPLIKDFEIQMRKEEWVKKNLLLKVKQHPIEFFDKLFFNPNSSLQLQKLLYEFIGFTVTDWTDTKQPQTGGKIIKKLMNQLKSRFNITDEEL